MRDLKKLSPGEIKDFFESFDEILCDCDGVIWYLGVPIQGAAQAIQKLRNHDKKVRFVSNNCLQTIDGFYNNLERAKFGSEKDAFVIPTMVLIDYLKRKKFDKEIFAITCRPIKGELEKNGFKVASNGPYQVEEKIPEFQALLKDNPNVGAVVVDIDVNLNYVNLNLAAVYLKRKGVELIFLGTDAFVPINKDLTIYGAHYFQQMLSDVAVEKPLYFAKPSDILANFITNKFNISNPRRVLFIGDALVQDISFANKNNFQSLLVLSGATTKEQMENWRKPEEQKPDFFVDSIVTLASLL